MKKNRPKINRDAIFEVIRSLFLQQSAGTAISTETEDDYNDPERKNRSS